MRKATNDQAQVLTQSNPTNATPTAQGGYIPGLDGIRAVAIGLVLFSHTVIFDQFNTLKGNGLNAGYTGVAIFFVLSGYLITGLLLREEEKAGNISLRLFYLRRAFRLFPALWLYLAVVFVIWALGGIPDHPLHSFVASLFYVRNLVGRGHETDHFWSLAIEEQFYLLWPLVLVALPRRDKLRFWIAIALFVVITSWRVYAANNGLASSGALYNRSDFRFDGPLLGCVLALGERVTPRAMLILNGTRIRSTLLLVIGVVALTTWVGLKLDTRLYSGIDSTVASLIGALFLMSQTGAASPVTGALSWAPLVKLGKISYGVYVWQELFLGPRTSALAPLRIFPIGLTITIAVAALSYAVVESPILRFKNYHLRRSSTPRDGGNAE